MNEVLPMFRHRRIDPVEMLAEDPLFLMYTSGTTGKPKGCQHSTAGYLSYVAGTSKYIQDIHPEDVYWCMADIGWITGHSYIVYGPLALAASSVVYTRDFPPFPTQGVRGASPKSSTSISFIPRRPRYGRCVVPGLTSRGSTIIASNI
jgi:acetyl-CoA synthetase